MDFTLRASFLGSSACGCRDRAQSISPRHLRFLGPVKIGDVVDVSVEVVELTEKNRRLRLHCECRVGDEIVLDGEGVLSVPPTPKPRHSAP